MPNSPQSSGEQNWWTSRGGEVYGPYDYQTILFCRRDGRIVDDDYVKCGDEPWQRAAEALPEAQAAALAGVSSAQPSKSSSQKWIIIGVVAGAAFMLLAALAIVTAIVFPVFGRARERAQATACLSNVRQLGMAVLMYATEHGEKLPNAESWEEDSSEYLFNEEILTCPTTRKHYVFNRKLSGVDLRDIRKPAEVPLLWEPALHAGGQLGPHLGQFNVGYVDGHAKMVDALPNGN